MTDLPRSYERADSFNPAVQQRHFDRKQRIALARMAQACQLDPLPYAREVGMNPEKVDKENATVWTHFWSQIGLRLPPPKLLELWNAVSRVISETGVMSPSNPIEGDPFAIFVTGICQNAAGHPQHEEYRQTAVVKTGHRVDQAEGEKIIAYLKAEANVNLCEICREPITVWQCDNTRVGTFAAQPNNKNLMMASTIRGSD